MVSREGKIELGGMNCSIFWFRFMQFHSTRLGQRETGLITPQLRETFYYARERKPKNEVIREVEPIRYNH